jgi:hypothetical protein
VKVPTGRLGHGELYALVAQVLATNPELTYTPAQIGNMMRRSPGAIANALVKLVDHGTARLVVTKPKTYQLAASDRPKPTTRATRRRASAKTAPETAPQTGTQADGSAS